MPAQDQAAQGGHHTTHMGHPPHVPLSESKGPVGSPGDIREHMEVYASCGNFVGKVDRVEGDRIKLTKKDSGAQIEGAEGKHSQHHHYISLGLVADVEGDKVRLSATGANAVTFEEEEAG